MSDYLIFYNDVLIAEVIDYKQGFIDIIRDMNAELEVVDKRDCKEDIDELRRAVLLNTDKKVCND